MPASTEAQQKKSEVIPLITTEENAAPTLQSAASQSEDIPAVEINTAEDIGTEANGTAPDDAVLPQAPTPMVSSPVRTDSEYVSIGDPATPVIEDDYWQEEHPNTPIHEVLPRTPLAPIATPVLASPESPFENIIIDESSPDAAQFRRLHKGPRPSISMLSIHEDIAASATQNLQPTS
jgi:hypothetical protein